MTEVDFRAIEPQIRSEYAPRRQRTDRQKSEIVPVAPKAIDAVKIDPTNAEFRENALRIFEMMDGAIDREREVRAKNIELEARLEQFQSTVTDQKSQIESLRLEVSEANRRTESVRERLSHFKAMALNIGGIVADMVQENE